MKKTVSLYLSFVIIFLTVSLNCLGAFAETSKPKCGLIYEKTNFKKLEATKKLLSTSEIPASFDLTDKMPAIGLQQGSDCTAWAAGYALNSHLQNDDWNWGLTGNNHLFSPNYLYNQACGYAGGGTSFYDICNLLVNQGCCTLDKWAYTANYTVHPTASQIANADNFKSSGWLQTEGYGNDETINSIKEYMATYSDPVLMGIPVSDDFDNLNSTNQIYDVYNPATCRGGHAITLIGYDDTRQAFKLQNSWGTDWGIDGYGWISYNLIKNAQFNDWINFNGFPTYGYVVNDIRTADQNNVYFDNIKFLKNVVGTQLSFTLKIDGVVVPEGGNIKTIGRNYRIDIKEDDFADDDFAAKLGTLVDGVNAIKLKLYESPYNGKYSEFQFNINVNQKPVERNVKLTDIKVIKNTGIGTSWKHSCKLGNSTLAKGQTIKTSARTLYLKSTEDDTVYDDVATRTTSIGTYRDLTVWENKYNGKHAIVRYYFTY